MTLVRRQAGSQRPCRGVTEPDRVYVVEADHTPTR